MSIRATTLAIALFAGIGLCACGGGSDSTDTASGGGQKPSPSPNDGGQKPNPSPSSCPSSSVNNMWLDKSLGCLAVGQTVIDKASSATGPVSEYSFIVGQRVYDRTYSSVLGANEYRYFSRILCVRNAPSGLVNSGYMVFLGTDLGAAFRASVNFPSGYNTLMITGSGNNDGLPTFVQESCSTSKHPIIIDFATKKIVALTPSAMSAVRIYDSQN